jgi:hypothetical protein
VARASPSGEREPPWQPTPSPLTMPPPVHAPSRNSLHAKTFRHNTPEGTNLTFTAQVRGRARAAGRGGGWRASGVGGRQQAAQIRMRSFAGSYIGRSEATAG